jgi:hypothetical protein
MRTQIVIIGGGPAGLLLSQTLHLNGIDSVVLERASRRAGMLEWGSVQMLREAGVGERMDREGELHDGSAVAWAGRRRFLIDVRKYAGRPMMMYAQTQLTEDLYAARFSWWPTGLLHRFPGQTTFELRAPGSQARFHHVIRKRHARHVRAVCRAAVRARLGLSAPRLVAGSARAGRRSATRTGPARAATAAVSRATLAASRHVQGDGRRHQHGAVQRDRGRPKWRLAGLIPQRQSTGPWSSATMAPSLGSSRSSSRRGLRQHT